MSNIFYDHLQYSSYEYYKFFILFVDFLWFMADDHIYMTFGETALLPVSIVTGLGMV